MAREHWTLLRVLRQLNGRTSTGARQATAAFRPHASASSRSAASSTQKPPMCSLVSMLILTAIRLRRGIAS